MTRARPDADLAFQGWWMVLWCALIHAATAPGQTIGVSAFIDPMIDALSVSRSAISTAYLVGTLAGAVALPAIGRWVDRVGIRHALGVVGIAFASVVALTGAAQNIVMLTLAFVGLRMLGQGSLSLISATGVSLWFDRRRGLALAVSATAAMGLMSLAPLTFGAIIDTVGWRGAWVLLGMGVAAIVVPIAGWAIVDRPEHLGQLPDGDRPGDTLAPARPGATAREALRSPAFWVLAGMHALSSALITGLTFHNTDVLGARGLTDEQAAAIFIPQMLGGVIGGFGAGWLSDRVSSRLTLPVAGVALGAGAVLATTASPGPAALLYGLVTGLALGSITALSGALLPRWYGTAHVGAIRGTATSIIVAASAMGPLLLAVGNDIAGSYRPVLLASAAASFAAGLAAAFVPPPAEPG